MTTAQCNRIALLTILAFVLFLSACAGYQSARPHRPDPTAREQFKAQVPAMLEWLKRQGFSGVAPVDVEIIPQEVIAAATGMKQSMGTCDQGVVFLAEGIRPWDSRARSLLLHELVHVQQNNCAIPRNRAERREVEEQAYAIQSLWHEEQYGTPLTFRKNASLR